MAKECYCYHFHYYTLAALGTLLNIHKNRALKSYFVQLNLFSVILIDGKAKYLNYLLDENENQNKNDSRTI